MYGKDNLEKDYTYWKCVLWSDETKLELVGHIVCCLCLEKKGRDIQPKELHNQRVVPYPPGNSVVGELSCVDASVVSRTVNFIRVEEITKKERYIIFLKETLKQLAA